MESLFHLVVMVTILISKQFADSYHHNNTKVCMGSNNGFGMTQRSVEERYSDYVQHYANCTTVEQNLEIIFLESNNNFDMTFLESIREVNGYVLIAGNEFDYLPLTNLRIIRGRMLYQPQQQQQKHGESNEGYSLFIAYNHRNGSTSVGLKEILLASLHEILAGNVFFKDNNLLCYEDTINWLDILASGIPEFNTMLSKKLRTCEECDRSCIFNNTKRHCWGPGPEKCQKITRLQCSENCDNRCFGTGPTQCCDKECAGGCGRNKTDCWACRNYEKDGSCIERCLGEKIYNVRTYKMETNPDPRYSYGAMCVKACPDHLLTENEACVTKCSELNIAGDDKKCRSCDPVCPKTCNSDTPYMELHGVSSENVANFTGCTVIDGNLKFIQHSYPSSKPLPDLSVFESLQQLNGYLLVEVQHPNFTSLSFMRNLRIIHGRTTRTNGASVSISYTTLEKLELMSLNEIRNGHLVILNNNNLTELGLVSLEKMRTGFVFIRNNKRLCYIDSINWTQIIVNKTLTARIGNNADQISWCDANNITCSSECSNDGCWGPDEKDCRFCKNYRYGERCVESCQSMRGLYSDEINGRRVCLHCHEECLNGCKGKEREDCFECRRVRDGPYCVANCPLLKYEGLNGTCEPCYEHCVSGCTGPATHLGLGGCNISPVDSMLVVYLETNETLCLSKDSQCPIGYYQRRFSLNVQTKNGSTSTRVNGCRKCDVECRTCDDAGAATESCECINYKYNSHCIRSCQKDQYSDSDRRCHRCHTECLGSLGCHGPTESDCNFCRNVRIYLRDEMEVLGSNDTEYIDVNNTFRKDLQPKKESEIIHDFDENKTSFFDHREMNGLPSGLFRCANFCPVWLPDKEKYTVDNIHEENVCAVKFPDVRENVEHSTSPDDGLNIGVPVVIGVVVIGMIVVIVVFLRRQMAKSQENKLRLEAQMTGLVLDEIVTPSNAKPDLSTLRLIKESELRRGNEIGSGAFGTVFKGVWIPEREDVKIPVAIKVLTEAANASLNAEFLDEARIMATVNHPCCIRIIAVCMTAQMMLITPLMPHGSLLDYVRKNKRNIGSNALITWSAQIARGMLYLEERDIVHRDLAARNVLVQGPGQVRITDFGLAKLLSCDEEQYQSAGGKMPIKWLALESIEHRIFTHKSDVWSYGVTLWELYTYGQRPYETIRAVDIAHHLEMGERLSQPPICTIDVYMIMIKCWMLDVDSRPTFNDLEKEFSSMSKDPGRFLVIPGDRLMRLPSVVEDLSPNAWMNTLSLSLDDGLEKFITADEYLHPHELQDDGHPLSIKYLKKLSSVDEEEYENSCCKSPSFSAFDSSTCDETPVAVGDPSRLNDLDAAAAARKIKDCTGKGGGRDRKQSIRYISDPCKDAAVAAAAATAEKKPADLKCISTDEADYLQPRSSSAANYLIVLDTADEPNDIKCQPKKELYLDLSRQTKSSASVGNPEYYLAGHSTQSDDMTPLMTPNNCETANEYLNTEGISRKQQSTKEIYKNI